MSNIKNGVLFTEKNGEKLVKFEIANKVYLAKVKEKGTENYTLLFLITKKQQVNFHVKELEKDANVIKKALSGLVTITVPVYCFTTKNGNFYTKYTSGKGSILFVLDSTKTVVLKKVKEKEFNECAQGQALQFDLAIDTFVTVFSQSLLVT